MKARDSQERRLRRRFNLELDLHCKLPEAGEILLGNL
jgi:hypothetical protein